MNMFASPQIILMVMLVIYIIVRILGVSNELALLFAAIAGLSAAAPPVSLRFMLTAASISMPYAGFSLPLLLPLCLLSLLIQTHELLLDATRDRTERILLLEGRDESILKAGEHELLFERMDKNDRKKQEPHAGQNWIIIPGKKRL